LTAEDKDKATARAQYNRMLEQYNNMTDDILRVAAEEAGREYTPGTTAKPPTDAYPGFKDRTKK
jgi:hypothetical protein